ncbi:hypothetical protein [Clostridium sp.]|uniref:hypothetical protein n=1 Tax=Clostridium sp. TaxID=1506 RepID=UPI003F4C6E68
MKIRKICFIGLMIFIVLISFIFWPRDIYRILGVKNIDELKPVYLNINHKYSILDNGTEIESYDPDKIQKLIDLIKEYKYIRIPWKGTRELDNEEFYACRIKDSNDAIITFVIIGKKYLIIKSNYGFYGPYRVVNKELDIEFIKKFYESF